MIRMHNAITRPWCLAVAISVLCFTNLVAEEPKDTTADLAEKVRDSIVVITAEGRDGRREGLGTGFVVGEDGLIATNFHVIGQGRAVSVETADGKEYEPVSVHASDRKSDLAVLRVKAKGLKPIPLGDSAKLREGQAVVAVGHPQRLRFSVVAGVVSGRREIEGQPMIQLAIPIEPGNSGGPVIDRDGKVVGIVTSKSLVTRNLGFAVESNSLTRLLGKPNPVEMRAWLTIGTLDPEDWKVTGGARWRQRAGRIVVDGQGEGIGARSLCLSQAKTPESPFEVSVMVHLEDEAGAAGLVFHSDGGDRHYGFYPSNGKLRFTRFDGPTVFTWTVLREEAVPHYRSGEWNTLKVRIEKGKFRCFVNDQFAFQVLDKAFDQGQVGLAKFRDTVAAFRRFQFGKEVDSTFPSEDRVSQIVKEVGEAKFEGAPPAALIDKLTPGAAASMTVLRERARELEKQAERLRQLARDVHHAGVLAEFKKVVSAKDFDLLHAALLIARLDNEEVDVDLYRRQVERMASRATASLPKDASEKDRLETLNRFFFAERGFHGSRADYYNRSNSYLNEVIDDREGLPITLSLIYLELGRRLKLNLEGVGLPGHFVVRHVPKKGEPQLIDVYEGGTPMSREEAARKVESITGEPLTDDDLAAVESKAILTRMLHNLIGVAEREDDPASAIRYLDAILTVTPDSVRERLMRAGLRGRQGDRSGAIADLDWVLEKRPEGIDLERVREFRELLDR